MMKIIYCNHAYWCQYVSIAIYSTWAFCGDILFKWTLGAELKSITLFFFSSVFFARFFIFMSNKQSRALELNFFEIVEWDP